MEMIKFEGIKYPSVIINMPDGEKKVSTESLNEALMNYNGIYVTETARIIDEEIFYFVDDKKITLKNDQLLKLILSEI